MLSILHVKQLYLGAQGENNAQTITIDVKPWLAGHPAANITIYHKRDGDEVPYPTGAVLDREEGVIRWTPNSTDTYVQGDGEAEIRMYENGAIKKSRKINTRVDKSVTAGGMAVGSGWQDYINKMEDFAEAAEDAKGTAVEAAGDAQDAQEAAEAARDAAQAAAGNFQGMTAEVEGLDADDDPTIEVEHEEGGLYNFKFGAVPGTTFTPEVSEQGVLSWTNDGGKENPESVNIKGPQGDPAPVESIVPAVEDWLEENIDPLSEDPPLDRSLSLPGAAAPADLVGNLMNALITSYYPVPLTWEEGSISTSTGEDVESDKTRSDTYNPTTYGDLLVKTSTTGMNIEYYDYEDGAYVWKANAWAATNSVHTIRKQYGYFRITTSVKYSSRPYDTIFCYKYIGVYDNLQALDVRIESELAGVYVAKMYASDGKKVTWNQTASNTTLDLSDVTGFIFEGYSGTGYSVSKSDILTAATASDYTTVSDDTITGNNFAILYNIETATVSIARPASGRKTSKTRILFSVYYGSFISGDIVEYEIRRRWQNTIKRISDLESIIDNDSVLPDYWLTYMQTKIRDVQEKDMMIGNHGDAFVFCTDQHYPTNDGNSPGLVDYVLKNSSVNTVIMGGDLIQGSNVSKQTGLNSLVDARNKYRTMNPRYLRGNHDSNTEIQGRSAELEFSEDEVYAVLMKPVESEIKASGQMYFYFDNSEQKIRYICLDTGHPDTHVIEDAQITWMQNRITELESGWTAVVITHQFFGTPPTKDGNGDKIEAGLDAIYDEVDAVIACVIAGHSHRDAYTTSAKGYPIIVTTCDIRGGEASSGTRTKGTTTEQAFDVFHIDTDPENRKIYATRIGFGEDREFSY